MPLIFNFALALKGAIAWFVVNIACVLVFRILFALGFGVISYVGVDLAFDPVINYIFGELNALSSPLKALFNELRIAEALGIFVFVATYVTTLRFANGRIGFRPQQGQLFNK